MTLKTKNFATNTAKIYFDGFRYRLPVYSIDEYTKDQELYADISVKKNIDEVDVQELLEDLEAKREAYAE